jgi:hypothetical protein
MGANPRYSEGEVIANKYVVEGFLGESPASRTFVANGNAGKLAIKMYGPELSARLLGAPDFFLKAGVMTEIEHDNLATCLDVQEEMGLVFVAHAFAEGQSFEEWARKHRADGNYFTRGLELLWQTSQGLAALHERTRHLNIHPGNVIVGPLVAKLCDWDPRALGNMEMTPDPLPGRPEYQGYRAPEAAGRNGFLSYPSTDLFSVAGLLYRLVRGEHPHSNPAQTLGEIRAFDKELAAFLSKAMHPRPEERFQDAAAFSDALWELQGAMTRLQERQPRNAPSSVPKAPAQDEPFFQDPPAAAKSNDGFAGFAPAKEPTLFGATTPQPAKSGNDTFFNFFPAEDASTPAAAPKPSAPSKDPFSQDPFQPAPPKSSGDTLFGAPTFPSQREAAKPAAQDFGGFDSRPSPRPAPSASRPSQPAPPSGGLSDLETPGTLFGSQSPLFSSPSGSAPSQPSTGRPSRNEPPPPPKPAPVSLSSLEKDPLDMAGSDPAAGFTAYGFKGAGDPNRTGIYSPEAKAAAAKAKMRMLLIAVGAIVLLVGLGGLFFFLRSNAAHKAGTVAETREPAEEPATGTPVAEKQAAPIASEAPHARDAGRDDVPYPEVAAKTEPPAHMETAPKAQPAKTAATGKASDGNGYSEPPMPVEPPRPGAAAEAQAAKAEAKPPKTAYKGNNHVTPGREAELMAMVQTRKWPNSASECLKAGDELNDLGKTAEANVAYSKALVAGDINDKSRVSAFGGLAVTFQSMGMRDQARDAVQQILAINPRNGFALKLKEKLK